MRRLVAASESEAIGYGGVSTVARATGVSRRAITEGLKVKQPQRVGQTPSMPHRIRREGAGRRRAMDKDPNLLADLDRLVDPVTRGDPESPLRWTCKSVRRLAEELQQEGHAVSYQTVAEVLHALDYSLQASQKTLEGSRHADRDAQFQQINRKAQNYLKLGEPVISVDTKKKELVGDFKNGGREWQIKGRPEHSGVLIAEIVCGTRSVTPSRRRPTAARSAGDHFPDHQEEVQQQADKAQAGAKPGETVLVGQKIQGVDSTRRPDVQVTKDGKTERIVEVERRPKTANEISTVRRNMIG